MANEILARAKVQYASRAKQCRLEVPEWGDGKKPLVVTWKPLTIEHRRRIYAPLDNADSADGGTISVRAVMWFALDDKGERLFDDMAEHSLNHETDADIVGKIATAMLWGVGGKAAAVTDQVQSEKNV